MPVHSVIWSFFVWILLGALAQGYPVGPTLSLDKLVEGADLIFKGTALTNATTSDPWFKPCRGFVAQATTFRVVAVLKGEVTDQTVAFQHYARANPSESHAYQPQYYEFEDGATYLVFAATTATSRVSRQLWENHKTKEDQGVIRCADARPPETRIAREVVWTELIALLRAGRPPDIRYAIEQLDGMSGETWFGTPDFDRGAVLEAIQPLIAHRDVPVAEAAIRSVGGHNPYLSDERTIFWLATVGASPLPGLAKMDRTLANPGGRRYHRELSLVADSQAPVATRALAVRALGLAREPAVRGAVARWLKDPAPELRAAATVLLADYPEPDPTQQLRGLATDQDRSVRAAVAHAAGFGQYVALADVLAKLLGDPERIVREAAAKSLLSFSPKDERVAAVFRRQLGNAEFRPLFLVALAKADPAPYLDALAEAVATRLEPANFWGGEIPAFTAWEILFRHVRAQPADALRRGAFDRYLDALETATRGSGSSVPRDLYAFYLQRGLTDRAQRFRVAAAKAATFDLDYYFKMVDENPGGYTRE